jgi:hypothetical protein
MHKWICMWPLFGHWFKGTGWFYLPIVFPPIRSVCYWLFRRCYRVLHCFYRLTALKSTNHMSSNMFMYIIRYIIYCILSRYPKGESNWKSIKMIFEDSYYHLSSVSDSTPSNKPTLSFLEWDVVDVVSSLGVSQLSSSLSDGDLVLYLELCMSQEELNG